MSDSPDPAATAFPSDEPAVIRRLPAGVEYTHVKQIVFGLSWPLDVFLCLRLQRGAACGAGGVMAWPRGRRRGGARARRLLMSTTRLSED